jgi:hypothetical protein
MAFITGGPAFFGKAGDATVSNPPMALRNSRRALSCSS